MDNKCVNKNTRQFSQVAIRRITILKEIILELGLFLDSIAMQNSMVHKSNSCLGHSCRRSQKVEWRLHVLVVMSVIKLWTTWFKSHLTQSK